MMFPLPPLEIDNEREVDERRTRERKTRSMGQMATRFFRGDVKDADDASS